MGKAYFNRKEEIDHPLGDFYCTPPSLVKVFLNNNPLDKEGSYLEPCAGNGAIANVLSQHSDNVTAFDLHMGENRQNFLKYGVQHDYIITNFPFSMWDLCVEHGKRIAKRKLITIGRTNYFGCVGRSRSDIWKGLSSVQIMNCMVDYRSPYREDGKFHVGGMVTAFFVWDLDRVVSDPIIKILDVQDFAVLGGYKEEV